MEIILDRHLATMQKFVAERKKVRRRRARGAAVNATLGRPGRF
jgi:hypothetical protein